MAVFYVKEDQSEKKEDMDKQRKRPSSDTTESKESLIKKIKNGEKIPMSIRIMF